MYTPKMPTSWGPKCTRGQAVLGKKEGVPAGHSQTEMHCKADRKRGVGSKGRAASCSVSSLGILYHVLVECTLHEY